MIKNPRLANIYAKSLFDISIEKNELDQVHNDMKFIDNICKQNPEFVQVLQSPVITSDKKNNVISAIFSTKVSAITGTFMKLLVNKTRENALPEIAPAFLDQYRKHHNISKITITTATPLEENQKEDILRQVKSTGKFQNIELTTKIDETIIGGFLLEVGDQLVDASIARDLRDIKKQFLNNEFIHKLR